jgi:Tol biopolymer transport system component/DNA-binding winged helix-turn-helix (wHTH) protein
MRSKTAYERIRFEGFEADFGSGELFYEERRVPMQEQPFQVLRILLENSGQLVTREELRNQLWPADTFVDFDHNLNKAVAKLREALGNAGAKSPLIETLTRRGYRFIGEIEVIPPALDEPAIAPKETSNVNQPTSPINPGTMHRWLLPGAALLVVGLSAASWYQRRPLPPPRISDYVPITYDGNAKNLAGADSSRLYFNRNFYDAERIAQVSISGGEIAPVPVALAVPRILDVSPDGSTLLVSSDDLVQPSLWSVRVPGGSTRRLLTNVSVTSAAWSPDGGSVVYNTVDNKNVSNIFVMKSDGTGVSWLTSARKAGWLTRWDVRWSPDGETIRFTNNDELWEISPNGSNLRRLLPAWTSRDICCGRWTSDGKFFAFLSQGANPNAFDRINWRGAQIWALDERRGLLRRPSSEPIQLTSGPIRWETVIPSKDGRKIFAQGRVVRGELVHFDVKSKQLQPWLGGISAESFTFSPDGKFMAYVTYPEGILWRANRDGSSPEQLTSRPMYPMNPRWSPDGAQIMFFDAASANRAQGYIIPSQGGTPSLLLLDGRAALSDPNWSPDGREIVFSSFSDYSSTSLSGRVSDADIRVLDLASHQVAILPGSKGNFSPRWSPNGRFIAGLTDKFDITIFDFQTKRWSLLFKKGRDSTCDYPTWSRDGQFIYFVERGRGAGVFRIRASGGTPELVLDLTGFRFTGVFGIWFGLDPHDAPLLIRDVGTEDIYALTLEEK